MPNCCMSLPTKVRALQSTSHRNTLYVWNFLQLTNSMLVSAGFSCLVVNDLTRHRTGGQTNCDIHACLLFASHPLHGSSLTLFETSEWNQFDPGTGVNPISPTRARLLQSLDPYAYFQLWGRIWSHCPPRLHRHWCSWRHQVPNQ
jgi:hypothetical protein